MNSEILTKANLKWLIKQILAIWSNGKSFFSKKRFESSISYFAGVGIILCYVWLNRHKLTNSEMLLDSGVLLALSGYTVKEIQKEKILDKMTP